MKLPSGVTTRFLLLSDSCGFVDVGRSLSDERTGLSFTIAADPLQRNHFRVKSPVELVTIFYWLRFETSLFVASYDSQCYGGGIWTRDHTGLVPDFWFTTGLPIWSRGGSMENTPVAQQLIYVNHIENTYSFTAEELNWVESSDLAAAE
jgi:hypothetical protein